jgi:hypothetical protein
LGIAGVGAVLQAHDAEVEGGRPDRGDRATIERRGFRDEDLAEEDRLVGADAEPQLRDILPGESPDGAG